MSAKSAFDAAKLATRLHFAAIHLLRRLKRADEGLELSTAELSTIATLVNRGAMTMTELAEADRVRPPTMTRRVQRLERDGYALRESSPSDGRLSVIRHTTRGWLALEEAAERRALELSRALGELDSHELEVLEKAAGIIERLSAGISHVKRSGAVRPQSAP